MSADGVPVLRVSQPGEVAQLVPYLLGFEPENSLVLVVTRQGRVEVTARADLADLQPAGQVEDLLDRLWTRFPDAQASLVAYSDDHASAEALLRRCEQRLEPGVVQQAMLVSGGTWRSADGDTGPVDTFGPVAAAATFHGLPRLSRRSDLEAMLDSAAGSSDLDDQVAAAIDKLPRPGDTAEIIALTGELISRNLPQGAGPSAGRLSAEAAIQLAVLAQVPEARQVAMLSMTNDTAPQHLQLWRAVVNQTPSYGAEAPLFLAGMAGWLSGDGAIAQVALKRSLEAPAPESQPRMGRLLDDILQNVVPPNEWRGIRAQMLAAGDEQVRHAVTGPHDRWETVPPPSREPERRRPDNPPPAPGIAV